MSISIPLSSASPFYKQNVELDGVVYNYRGEYWALSIYEIDETVIIDNVRLTVGAEIISRYGLTAPPGALSVIATDGTDDPIGRDDLGARISLIYTTGAEIAAI